MIRPVSMDQIEGPETPSKRRLIAAGEELLGERGFNGTALQDIALAAGNANKYAIQYHFGGKDGLIAAILTLRLRWIDRRRTELLARANDLGLLDNIPALLEVLYIPVIEQVDDRGRNSFARFRLQYYARPDYNPFADHSGGITDEVAEHITTALGRDPEPARERLRLQGFVLLAALVDRDNRIAGGHGAPSLEGLLTLVKTLTIGALHA